MSLKWPQEEGRGLLPEVRQRPGLPGRAEGVLQERIYPHLRVTIPGGAELRDDVYAAQAQSGADENIRPNRARHASKQLRERKKFLARKRTLAGRSARRRIK